MKKDTTATNIINNDKHKNIKPAEFDFKNIENRLKELKEIEKKLLAELEKF